MSTSMKICHVRLQVDFVSVIREKLINVAPLYIRLASGRGPKAFNFLPTLLSNHIRVHEDVLLPSLGLSLGFAFLPVDVHWI